MKFRLIERLKRVWQWLSDQDVITLVLLALIAGGIWIFAEVADEVVEGGTQQIDEQILLAMRNPDDLSDPLGPEWVEEIGRDYTALGGIGVTTMLTLGSIGYLLLAHKERTALFITAAVGGGALISTLLKEIFDRPRPDLVLRLSYAGSASFPSGHSIISAVTYLTLAALLGTLVERRRERIYLLLVATLLTILIGISRVYLGVHWPTDVLAGWAAGAVWAILCWQVARWLQRRGEIEGEQNEATPSP